MKESVTPRTQAAKATQLHPKGNPQTKLPPSRKNPDAGSSQKRRRKRRKRRLHKLHGLKKKNSFVSSVFFFCNNTKEPPSCKE